LSRTEYTSTSEQRQATRAQFAEFAERLANAEPRELPRTYGYEIETPDADTVRDSAVRYLNRTVNPEREAEGLELIRLDSELSWKADGSITRQEGSSDCECTCSDCNYHDCDCENCDDRNTDPDHDCGSSDCSNVGNYQEITSLGGTTTTHPTSLQILAHADLDEAEINQTCGLHIHVGSHDLSPMQVGAVISAYRASRTVMNALAGRTDAYYAQDNREEDISYARRGIATEKYRAVNTAPHFNSNRPDTIEFRQHEGTNDANRVRAWAVLLVALVEYAKANRPTYWLSRCQDFTELAKELEVKI
jgi:hypothetical protein